MIAPLLHFLYFSCGAHVHYLRLSLQSLARVQGSFLGGVYVGMDPDDPINPEDRATLEGIGLPLQFKEWGKVTGYGELTVVSEMAAFRDVADKVAGDDWIVKVDSDVLFLSDWIFHHVRRQNRDLVGHKERAWGTFAYSQGGCYFLRASFVPSLKGIGQVEVHTAADTLLREFHNVAAAKGMWKMPQCPEDALFHRLVEQHQGRIKLVRYFLPLWQVDRLKWCGRRPRLKKPSLMESVAAPAMALGVWLHDFMLARSRYSVIHFMSCKERMPAVFTLLALNQPGKPGDSFSGILTIP
jgi:hypothetical protein